LDSVSYSCIFDDKQNLIGVYLYGEAVQDRSTGPRPGSPSIPGVAPTPTRPSPPTVRQGPSVDTSPQDPRGTGPGVRKISPPQRARPPLRRPPAQQSGMESGQDIRQDPQKSHSVP
jgi:hypothetical protein